MGRQETPCLSDSLEHHLSAHAELATEPSDLGELSLLACGKHLRAGLSADGVTSRHRRH